MNYQTKFKNQISQALNEAERGENNIMQGLRVDRISQTKTNISEWFDRSLTLNGLLQNKHLQRHRIKIVVRGTCALDSILQMFTWQYIDDDRFRKAIDELIETLPDADTVRFIAIFAQQGVGLDVYRLRSEIFTKICFINSTDDFKYFRCMSSPIDSLAEFFTPFFPSVTSISNCRCRIERKFTTLPFDYDNFKGKPVFEGPRLQEAINKRIGNGRVLCKCCGQLATENHALSHFVFVLLGPTRESLYLVKKLKGMPLKMTLQGEPYDLRCFIDYKIENHSKVNCWRDDSKWYQYDDNFNTALPLENESLPYMLMYRRRN